MKSFALSTIFSIAALLSAGVANAQQKPIALSALPSQNFAFCLSSDATVVVSTSLQTEVGVVITNVGNSQTNTSGNVVVAANNFYGNGAGGEWTSGMGPSTLTGGSCYNVAMMSKTTSPNGSTPWTCGQTTGTPTLTGATMSGLVTTTTQVTSVAAGYVVAGVSSTLNNAPSVNCPY